MKKTLLIALALVLVAGVCSFANAEQNDDFTSYIKNLRNCKSFSSGKYSIKGLNNKGLCEVKAPYTEMSVDVTGIKKSNRPGEKWDMSGAEAKTNTGNEKIMSCTFTKEQTEALYNSWIKENDETYIKQREAQRELMKTTMPQLADFYVSFYSRLITTYLNDGTCK